LLNKVKISIALYVIDSLYIKTSERIKRRAKRGDTYTLTSV